MDKLYSVSKKKKKNKKTLELTVAQIISSLLQNSGSKKDIWPLGLNPLGHSGINQMPYTVELTNRFKGPDLVNRVPEKQWTEVHNIVQEAVTKTIPRKRNVRRQSGCLRMPYK